MKHTFVQKLYLFDCFQMLPLICFLLHPNRLNVSKTIPQMRELTFIVLERKVSHFSPVTYMFIKDGCGCGCGCGCEEVYWFSGVWIPDRHRYLVTHLTTPTHTFNIHLSYQQHPNIYPNNQELPVYSFFHAYT